MLLMISSTCSLDDVRFAIGSPELMNDRNVQSDILFRFMPLHAQPLCQLNDD
jgi:hypothetical protein